MDTTRKNWASPAHENATDSSAKLPWMQNQEQTQFGPRPIEGGDVAPELLHLGHCIRLEADFVLGENMCVDGTGGHATHDLVLGAAIGPQFVHKLFYHANLIRSQ